MGNQRYTMEFREQAVRQVLDLGYSVKDVAENLGVSRHSSYRWLSQPGGNAFQQKPGAAGVVQVLFGLVLPAVTAAL